tara:strand:- start:23 stop:577 length:555 start_codon:yes stop_codon:yes gene_type:complete
MSEIILKENKKNNLSDYTALVLNADYRPLSYLPLSTLSWQDAVKATFLERVNIVSVHDIAIRSPSVSLNIPSVVVLKKYVKRTNISIFNRANIFLRDDFSCQYCGSSGPLTFDHVIPKSKGGKTSWENVVTACISCNVKKGSKDIKTVGMKMKRKPFCPSPEFLIKKGFDARGSDIHYTWKDFI